MPYNKKFMLEAIRVANENIENQGGPFGALAQIQHRVVFMAAGVWIRSLYPGTDSRRCDTKL